MSVFQPRTYVHDDNNKDAEENIDLVVPEMVVEHQLASHRLVKLYASYRKQILRSIKIVLLHDLSVIVLRYVYPKTQSGSVVSFKSSTHCDDDIFNRKTNKIEWISAYGIRKFKGPCCHASAID